MKTSLPRRGREGDGVQHVVIVGANGRSRRLAQGIVEETPVRRLLEGVVDDSEDRRAVLATLGLRYLGTIAVLDRLLIERIVDCVYVCLPLRSSYDAAQRVVDLCETAGVPVFVVADLLPLHAESETLWCMELQFAAKHAEWTPERPVLALKSRLGGALLPLRAAVSAVWSELASRKPVLSGQEPRMP